MATINSGKRRKCHEGPLSSGRGRLIDLPEALLATVAAFLPGATSVFFATAISSSSPASEAILSCAESRGVLDFGDIEKALSGRLTDGDIAEILKSYISSTELRTLKLAGCVNITGAGLGPLRGYSSLEQIDLSLVKQYDSPTLETVPRISPDVVICVLNAIIDSNDSSLKHIQLPKQWREEKDEIVQEFVGRYSQYLEDRCRLRCVNTDCTRRIRSAGEGDFPLIGDGPFWVGYGIQNVTCYQCTKSFCISCIEEGMELGFCKCCERMYCSECEEVLVCEGICRERIASCGVCNLVQKCDGCLNHDQTLRSYCADHSPLERCGVCNRSFCGDWCNIFVSHCSGPDCNKKVCTRCMDTVPIEEAILYCEACRTQSCRECLVQNGNGCAGCRAGFGIEAGVENGQN